MKHKSSSIELHIISALKHKTSVLTSKNALAYYAELTKR